MAYTIYKSDGTPITVPDNAVDVQFYNPTANGAGRGLGTQLVGRNAVDYGAPVAQSFLQITENFAGTVLPSDTTSLVGQLWFDKNTSSLNVKVTTSSTDIGNWRKLVTTDSTNTGTVPTVNPSTAPAAGDLQTLSGPTRVNIWADGAWRQVFPAIYS
jgi:hypothetical protein